MTGSLTLDLLKYHDSPQQNLTSSSYSGIGSPSELDWISLKIKNPDGSFFDSSYSFPESQPPHEPTDHAYVLLAHLKGDYYGVLQSNLIVSRGYASPSLFPNFAELGLRANGENVSLLTSSANFDDVIIKPEFANMHNYGRVLQANEIGLAHEYYFSIDSFERKPTDVPEPSTLVFLFFCLLAMGIKRYKYCA